MLPNRIDRYIVQVIAVLAHFPEHGIVLFRQAADDIRLRQVHLVSPPLSSTIIP